jgi:hypothetical protein
MSSKDRPADRVTAHEAGAGHPVVSHTSIGIEFGAALRADFPTQIEWLATVRADVPTQIEWANTIAVALRELRPHIQNTALLDEAEATTKELHAELASPQPRSDVLGRLWYLQVKKIITVFLNAFAVKAGADMADQAVHKLIELLSKLF